MSLDTILDNYRTYEWENATGQSQFSDEKIDQKQAKQAILKDLLDLMPKPSQRSSGVLNADTLNAEYQRGNFNGYKDYYTELRAKLTKYCGENDEANLL
jgi:hypothetical protein